MGSMITLGIGKMEIDWSRTIASMKVGMNSYEKNIVKVI